MKILVTGAAGFIGFHLVARLLARGDNVIGLDSLNDYYDVRLKYGRLSTMGISQQAIAHHSLVESTHYPNYQFLQLNLVDKHSLQALFAQEKFDSVVHLAAQAGVRYSLTNPDAYVESNIAGCLNILESCRHFPVRHLVFASSSSVYGLNTSIPFSTRDNVDHPISLYAASKKANELMAHTYAHLFQIPVTGLRFFTVYGPWGRPDMAYFTFTKAILEEKPIQVFNLGEMQRDFTYIDDIIEGVVRVLDKPPMGNPQWSGIKPEPNSSKAPYRIYNIGNSSPVKLLDFIGTIEKILGKTAQKHFLPMQAGDVPATWADVSDLTRDFNYQPQTSIQVGIQRFIQWYLDFYRFPE